MENRSWRIARRNGFTAIETVVTVVVLAILAAYATPKLFGLKEQAAATEETLKIKDIEARHTQEILKAGKRGDSPRLGDVVGFRPEVVAEPAPDEATVLYTYSYYTAPPTNSRLTSLNASSDRFGYPALSAASYTAGRNWQDPNDDEMSGCLELVNGLKDRRFFNVDGGYGFLDSFELSSTGDDYQVSPTQPVPSCQIGAISYRMWCLGTSTSPSCLPASDVPPAAAALGYTKIMSTARTYDTDQWYQIKLSPTHYRYSCEGHTQKYGVPYALSGASGGSRNISNHQNSTTRIRVSTTPLYYEQVYTESSPPAPISGAKCVRQGPAPAVPPSDPGDPGAYSMAQDGSGYCLSPGRKLPTYKDSAGTPTSSASDSVVELATEAVDDPTNCPG